MKIIKLGRRIKDYSASALVLQAGFEQSVLNNVDTDFFKSFINTAAN